MSDSKQSGEKKNKAVEPTHVSTDPTLRLDVAAKDDKTPKDQPLKRDPLTDDLLPGSQINRIVIENKIGQGGMGAVYLAYDEKLQRQVAIKSIKPEYLSNTSTQQRFIREAQILSKINHPSICQIYDYIETDHGDFLVLEYIKGQQLYRCSLNPAQTLDALIALAEALAVAHQHEVIHRDLKPDNVMVADNGQVKVLDFGIAQSMNSLSGPRNTHAEGDACEKNTADLTQKGSLVGTIRYMSPEQARGAQLTTASDIYALGVMALEMLSKKPAYQVLETQQLLQDVQDGHLVDIHAVPPAYRPLIALLTQKSADKRPNAEEVVFLLKKIKSAPLEKRRKRLRLGWVFLMVLAVVVVVWQWQAYSMQQKQSERFDVYQSKIDELVKASEQIYALPLHNVRPEIDALFQQAAVLVGQVKTDELLDDAQKNRLYGLVYLEAESYDLAVKFLTSGGGSHAELASAWIGSYMEKVTGSVSFVQALQSEEIRNKYLLPALNHVEMARKAAQAQGLKEKTWHQAFWVAQKQSFNEAVTLLDGVIANEAWNNEAVALKALLLSAMAQSHLEQGQWEAAQEKMVATADTYRQAAQMVRSYPGNYFKLCGISLNLLVDAVQRTSDHFDSLKAQAIEDCQQHLVTQPGAVVSQGYLSLAHWLDAQWQLSFGRSADQALAQAKLWNRKAQDNVATMMGFRVAALIEVSTAESLQQKGLPVGGHLDTALNIMNDLIKKQPEWELHLIGELLLVHSHIMRNQLRLMKPTDHWYQRSLDRYQQMADAKDVMAESLRAAMRNMSTLHYWHLLSLKYQGQLRMEDFNSLDGFFQHSIQTMAGDPGLLINFALVKMLMLEITPVTEISSHLVQINQLIDDAEKINKNNNTVKIAHAMMLNWQAVVSDRDYELANQHFESLVDAAPQLAINQQIWAEALLIQLRFADNGDEIKAIKRKALALIDRAIALDPLNQTYPIIQQKLLQ